MNNFDEANANNVFPIRKADRFGVYLCEVTSNGEVIEGESVGIAFMKDGSNKFRLKLFVFPENQYFVVPDRTGTTNFLVLSLEEYVLPNGEVRKSWNRIGDGRLNGKFIALRIQLLPQNIFLCVFGDETKTQEVRIAS